jgi:hypothetical protein
LPGYISCNNHKQHLFVCLCVCAVHSRQGLGLEQVVAACHHIHRYETFDLACNLLIPTQSMCLQPQASNLKRIACFPPPPLTQAHQHMASTLPTVASTATLTHDGLCQCQTFRQWAPFISLQPPPHPLHPLTHPPTHPVHRLTSSPPPPLLPILLCHSGISTHGFKPATGHINRHIDTWALSFWASDSPIALNQHLQNVTPITPSRLTLPTSSPSILSCIVTQAHQRMVSTLPTAVSTAT